MRNVCLECNNKSIWFFERDWVDISWFFLLFSFKKRIFVYLKVRIAGKREEPGRVIFSIHCFIPQVEAMVGAVSGWKQEPGAHQNLPHGWPKHFVHLQLLLLGHGQGVGQEVELPGCNLALTWDTDLAESNINCYGTTLAYHHAASVEFLHDKTSRWLHGGSICRAGISSA